MEINAGGINECSFGKASQTPSRLLQRAGLNVELKVVFPGAETWRCGCSWLQATGEKGEGMGTGL